MFRASKIELGPEVNTRRIAEDAKYHTRSLMNSTSSNVNNRMDEAINAMEEVKKETLAKYYETNEKLRAKNILLENTINELLSRIEYLEGTLGVNPNDHKKATEPVIPSTVAITNTEEKINDVVDEEPSSEKTEDTETNKKSKKGEK